MLSKTLRHQLELKSSKPVSRFRIVDDELVVTQGTQPLLPVLMGWSFYPTSLSCQRFNITKVELRLDYWFGLVWFGLVG